MFSQDQVKEYYDKTGYQYHWFYSDKKSLGLHYGFWDAHTKNSSEALINVYKEIQKHLQLKEDKMVLDAGCGIGGASFWLAEHTDGKYIGITISPEQLKKAEKYRKNKELTHKTSFLLKDYHSTGFSDEFFDSVFFIESSCYADLNVMTKEMMRILKPGGKMIIADFVHPRIPDSSYQKKMVEWFCKGFKLPRWQTKADYLAALSNVGFENLIFVDKTSMIRRSVNRIYFRTLILAPVFGFLRLVRGISKVEFENGLATYSQKKLYDMGLFKYGIFIVTKPE